MTPFLLHRPHSGQVPILAHPGRFKVVRCGRRFGKTILGQISTGLVASQEQRHVGWFVPEDKDIDETWREMRMRWIANTSYANDKPGRIVLTNNSVIERWTLHNKPDAGRGRKYDLIIVDEAGKLANLRRWWDLVGRATLIDRAGKALIISTPNVIGPDFDDMFDMALADRRQWHAFTARTFDNPHLPKQELEEIMALRTRMPGWAWDQEYLAIPAPTSGGFFARGMIQTLIATTQDAFLTGNVDVPNRYGPDLESTLVTRDLDDIRWVEDEGGALKLWHELHGDRPDQSRRYGIGADIGAGVGASDTVFSIGDLDTREKLAEYAWPGISPESAARLLVAIATWYGGRGGVPVVQFEINGPGEAFCREVLRMEYPRLMRQPRHRGDMTEQHSKGFGWRSTPQTKLTLLDQYRQDLETARFRNPSARALQQCLSYRFDKMGRLVSEGSSNEPGEGVSRAPHGDIVIADALLNQLMRVAGDASLPKPPPEIRSVKGWLMKRHLEKAASARRLTW